MEITIQLKTIYGKIIFEYKKENNSIFETIKEYIRQELENGKHSADLRYAYLRNAYLPHINLNSADLSHSDLSSADLRYSDLSHVNLSYSDLSHSDLRYSNLSYSDLSSADLSYAYLDKRYIQISCIGSSKGMTTYCFDDDFIWCGCFKGTLEGFEKECKSTHKNNPQYLKEYLGAIKYIKSLK